MTLKNEQLRDELKAYLDSVGILAWPCFVGPAACLGALDRGKFLLVEASGRGMNTAQLSWKRRVVDSGGICLRASSIADLERQLFGSPPWRLTPAEIDDALSSLPDLNPQIPF